MTARQPEPDKLANLVRDMAELMDATPNQTDFLDALMRSVASAMLRVPDDKRAELQGLVSQFLADPGDRETISRIGAMLRPSDH